MTTAIPRLDILIYAHDGRGLGHASRSIAIGMALRRLYPELRVLFVSGCRMSQELIGQTALDWLKLPSYETEVIQGKSRGITGNSMFTDSQLGELRAAQLRQLVELYRPGVVLCDHTPQGKHKELIPAITTSVTGGTKWVLGVRGVVGGVPQATSALARDLFINHFYDLFWYGDHNVLGGEHLLQLEKLYGTKPFECGYVSRLSELKRQSAFAQQREKTVAVTVAVPWQGEHTLQFITVLSEVIAEIGDRYGKWHIYIDGWEAEDIQKLLGSFSHCRLEPPSGARYFESLLESRAALIYGGYNSLMDILSLELPAVVVMRKMHDNEQQIHLEKLNRSNGNLLAPVEECGVGVKELQKLLESRLSGADLGLCSVKLGGAENAAKRLNTILEGVLEV